MASERHSVVMMHAGVTEVWSNDINSDNQESMLANASASLQASDHGEAFLQASNLLAEMMQVCSVTMSHLFCRQ